MALVTPEWLRFVIDDALSQADGETVEFVPLTGPAPAPCAEDSTRCAPGPL
ncbi:MAG: hypothetical protein JWR70_247 [Modestobacter sp.]|jgi:hypothetical protein|nr:hypothetical protein [Modestobacter sp.]